MVKNFALLNGWLLSLLSLKTAWPISEQQFLERSAPLLLGINLKDGCVTVCDQVCGQKNLSLRKASAYSDRNQIIFTKTWNLKNLKKSLKTFKVSIFFIRFYQLVLSPYFGGRCKYYPSCSNYAIESFENFGFLTAFIMTSRRLGSCHPFSKNKNYYDPVPLGSKGI